MMATSMALKKRDKVVRHKRDKFVKAVTDPLSDTFLNKQESAIIAGYSPTYANSLFQINQANIVRALDKLGMTDDYLAEQLQIFFGKRDRLCLDALQFLARLRGNYAPERRMSASLNLSLLSEIELEELTGEHTEKDSK